MISLVMMVSGKWRGFSVRNGLVPPLDREYTAKQLEGCQLDYVQYPEDFIIYT